MLSNRMWNDKLVHEIQMLVICGTDELGDVMARPQHTFDEILYMTNINNASSVMCVFGEFYATLSICTYIIVAV